MPEPTPAPAQPNPFQTLQERLAKGQEFLTRAELPPGQVKMWTGSVRGYIRAMFGSDSPADLAWPKPDTPFPPDQARETLAARVAMLKRFVDGISGATRAFDRGADRVFIGHGRSPMWLLLREFLQTRLGLRCDEFNRESAAGIATSDRLEEMLGSACFAFLVMTAENAHADDTLHARENVIHEIGMFQARLGFRRAIMLVEDGCATFSNVHGITNIRFPAGDIGACFEEIRRVLEREGIISGLARG